MLSRRRGFTLIELLVVIAIIGILAAMLFPVFARARESARKTQCLANVKNIAIAVNMYLTDYDRFPPDETSGAIQDWFQNATATEHSCGGQAFRASWANPYIRWPVILDDYTKNRDIWRCPSAKWSPSSMWIVAPGPTGNWFQYLVDNYQSLWSCVGYSEGGAPCSYAYPPGWGGDITDSLVQQSGNFAPDSSNKAFDPTIGCASVQLTGTSPSSLNDSARTVVCGDGTQFGGVLQGSDSILYDICATCGKADWENCTWTQDCNTLDKELGDRWASDPTFRAQYTRHLGGSNVGFADGHAKWYMADAFKADAPYTHAVGDDDCVPVFEDKLEGICP